MKTRFLVTLFVGLLLAAPALFAADGGFKLTGSVSLGGQLLSTSDTVDEGKLREYRDLTSGLLTYLDLQGRSRAYHLDLYAENLGRTDMYIDLKGGHYGSFKYRLFSDSLEHFFTEDARTPFSGAGTTNQTSTFPRLDPSTWNTYDLAYDRRNDGLMFEWGGDSPWYVRADANELSFDGNKLQAYANGTSSGQGFVDLAVPVDFKTRNYSLETGYASKRFHVALAYLDSKFENGAQQVSWTNPYFGNNNPPVTSATGIDTSWLPADSDLQRFSFNGMVKQLPFASTLAFRYTQSETTSDQALGTSQLIGSATTVAYGPAAVSPATFRGKLSYDTWSVNWSGQPTEKLEFRLWANGFERDNESSHVVFSGFTTATNSLGCVGVVGGTGEPGTSTGPRICENEPFTYDKSGLGGELAWRFNRHNKLTGAWEESQTDREYHPDSDSTDETRYSLEYRNTSLESMVATVKYLRIERDSNFLSPALPNTVWSYDVANMERDIIKLAVDITPRPAFDLGFEYYYKSSKYGDSPAGRTADDRQEYYVSAAVGNPDVFRLRFYLDYEEATTDARLVNRNSTTGAINYKVFTGIDDEFEAAGLGFDWPVSERLTLDGALTWNRSTGLVDFLGAAGAQNPPATLLNIPNYGNNERLTLNVKGVYAIREHLELTAGLAYEDATFDDIQYNPYSYVLPATPLVGAAQTTAAYLSGFLRDPDYNATIGYLLVTYKF